MSGTELTILTLLLAVLILAVWTFFLDRKLRKALRSKTGSFDESIYSIDKDIKNLNGFRQEIEKYLITVEKRLKASLQGVGTVRFNAFDNSTTGGNQSFASAFLDENKNGVVLSCIHARGFVGVYAKPVEKGQSKHDLSGEEKQAVTKALEKIASAKN